MTQHGVVLPSGVDGASLLRSLPDPLVLIAANGCITWVTDRGAHLVGQRPELLIGRSVLDLVAQGPDRPAQIAALSRVLGAPGLHGPFEVSILTADGRSRLLEFVVTNASDDPQVGQIVASARDVTARLHGTNGRRPDPDARPSLGMAAGNGTDTVMEDQTALLERIARGAPVRDSLRGIAELAARRLGQGEVVVGFFDENSYVSMATAIDEELLTVLERTGVSRPPAIPPSDSDTGIRSTEAWDSVVRAASGGRFERAWVADLLSADGCAGRVVLLRHHDQDFSPEELDLMGLAVDLASIALERHHLEARLAHGALHDDLTGLPNRRYLLSRLSETFSTRGVRAGVLFVDIDRFKLINDSLGHEAGDALLREITARFQGALRPADLVARVGGDEFVVLCPDLEDPQAAAALAGRLIDSLVEPFDLPGGRVVVSASIGVAHAVGPADPAEVLQDADLAMYDAKQDGGHRIGMFHVGLRNKAVVRLQTENAFREALRADEMTLHFQPVVRIRDRQMVGVEALLRWERPGIGLVKPGAFVPVATDTGLILPLGRWVIEQACEAAARWPSLEVAANLSARQLADADLVDFVADCLARNEVPPARLCLEVTEADLVTDPDSVVEQLRRFKELGVRLAIDDFGTGFATLDYLRRFSAADILKVDASFVAGITDPGSHDLAIVSAALVLADNLGFETVAEGVETEAQRLVLESLRCELAQGHLFSESVTAEEIDALVASGGKVGVNP